MVKTLILVGKGWLVAHYAKLAGAASFVTVIFVGAVCWQTFAPELPMRDIAQTASASRNSLGVSVHYTREIEVVNDFIGTESRYMVENESGEQIILHTSAQTYHVGKATIKRTFFLPAEMHSGQWCIYAVLQWTPRLSTNSHFIESKPACFKLD